MGDQSEYIYFLPCFHFFHKVILYVSFLTQFIEMPDSDYRDVGDQQVIDEEAEIMEEVVARAIG